MDRAALTRIGDRCEVGAPLEPADGIELMLAIRGVLAGSYNGLDEALGMCRRRGQRTNRTIAQNALRDELLRQCAAQCFAGVAISAQAAAIDKELSRYASGAAWRLDQRKGMPPSYTGTAKEFWFRLCAAGVTVPKQRRLITILGGSDECAMKSTFSLHSESSGMGAEEVRTANAR